MCWCHRCREAALPGEAPFPAGVAGGGRSGRGRAETESANPATSRRRGAGVGHEGARSTPSRTGEAGKIELADAIFGLPVRPDILHPRGAWQLAKRRAGTHKSKRRGEINGDDRQAVRQKGTGRARHGAATATQFRGGARAFGPVPRDHAHGLPKKVRRLGLKVGALGQAGRRQADGARSRRALEEPKTKELAAALGRLGWSSALLIDGAEIDGNFAPAARNLAGLRLLPSAGANVYDILRRDMLVLTTAAVARSWRSACA